MPVLSNNHFFVKWTEKRESKDMSIGAKGTGYLRKRSNGTWEGQYLHDGVRKSIYGTDYAEVRKRLNVICTGLLNDTHVEVSVMTLGGWLDFWLERYSKPVTRQSTYISYETYIRVHIKPSIGDVSLRHLTAGTMQNFFNVLAVNGRKDRKSGGLSTKTLRNIRNMLHLSLEQAIVNELLVKNVMKLIKLPKQRKQEMRVLSVQEQQQLEEAIRQSNEVLPWGILFALYTGVRLGELLALRWSDINEAAGSVYINNSLRRQSIKGEIKAGDYTIIPADPNNKTALMIGHVKTQKANRVIYLPQKAMEALSHFKDWQEEMKLKSGARFNKMNLVICTEQGLPVDARTYQDVFGRMVARSGIVKANFHCTRHTFATRALERNADLNTLAELLGHAQPSTTLNMYGHSFDDRKRKLMLGFDT